MMNAARYFVLNFLAKWPSCCDTRGTAPESLAGRECPLLVRP
jgi:hypothetical protein